MIKFQTLKDTREFLGKPLNVVKEALRDLLFKEDVQVDEIRKFLLNT